MSGPLCLTAAPPPVLLLRVPTSLLERLSSNPAAPISIEFGPDRNQFIVDGIAAGFTAVPEQLPHDVVCRVEDEEGYSQVGSVVQRLTLERQLDVGLRDRVRGLGAEAERKRREHHSELLDENGKGKRPAKRKSDAPPPTLQPPKPRLVEIPAAPQMSAADVRARVIHLLALRSQNDLAIRAACRAARSGDVNAVLAEVARPEASGLYALRDDLLLSNELLVDTWPHYSNDDRAFVRQRLERVRNEAPLQTHEEYERAKRRFEIDYARYKTLHEQLDDNRRHFENLSQEWTAAQDPAARHAVAERIDRDYAERAARVAQSKTEFHTLHVQLASLKQRMRDFLAGSWKTTS